MGLQKGKAVQKKYQRGSTLRKMVVEECVKGEKRVKQSKNVSFEDDVQQQNKEKQTHPPTRSELEGGSISAPTSSTHACEHHTPTSLKHIEEAEEKLEQIKREKVRLEGRREWLMGWIRRRKELEIEVKKLEKLDKLRGNKNGVSRDKMKQDLKEVKKQMDQMKKQVDCNLDKVRKVEGKIEKYLNENRGGGE